MEGKLRAIIILAFSLVLAWPSLSLAEVVGRLTQVEGRVELLKGGKLPATEAKAQDGVEPGDVLRTKSLSRAQITFLDNTTVTISPEARIAIEEYMFDPAKGKRSAVMQLFQGLAHFVVTQVYKVQEPDFIVKTHTAAMGVRGTDVGIRLSPNETTFLNFHGLVRVANIFPEVGDTAFKRAEKTAFAFGPAFVDLDSMHGSVVARGLPPTLAFAITDQDRQLFMGQMQHGIMGRRTPAGFTGGNSSGLAGNLPNAVNPAVTNLLAQTLNNLAITPRLVAATTTMVAGPAAVTPMESFTFSQIFSGGSFSYTTSGASFNIANFSASFSSISRTVAYPGVFTNTSLTFTATATTGSFPSTGDAGSFIVSPTNNSFSVSGPQGGTLTGTGTLQGTAAGPLTTTTVNLSGPVKITPNGTMTFTPTGTFTQSGGTPTSGNVTNANLTAQH
jgi:hypothetical protein